MTCEWVGGDVPDYLSGTVGFLVWFTVVVVPFSSRSPRETRELYSYLFENKVIDGDGMLTSAPRKRCLRLAWPSVFGPAWATLYTLMAVSLTNTFQPRDPRWALDTTVVPCALDADAFTTFRVLVAVHILLNKAWSVLFWAGAEAGVAALHDATSPYARTSYSAMAWTAAATLVAAAALVTAAWLAGIMFAREFVSDGAAWVALALWLSYATYMSGEGTRYYSNPVNLSLARPAAGRSSFP